MYPQFRFIRSYPRGTLAGDQLLAFCSGFAEFMPENRYCAPKDFINEYDLHEYAHCVDLVERGQPQRLKLHDFGYPKAAGGHRDIRFTQKTALIECRVIAIQLLLEDMIPGFTKGAMISVHLPAIMAGTVLNGDSRHVVPEHQRGEKDRLTSFYVEAINQEKKNLEASIKDLLRATNEYILSECREFI